MRWKLLSKKRKIRDRDILLGDLVFFKESTMPDTRKVVAKTKCIVRAGTVNDPFFLWVGIKDWRYYNWNRWNIEVRNLQIIDVKKSPDVKRLLLLEGL